MPIYEYKCKKCAEKFELRLGFFHNKKSVKCPRCGGEDPERVFSPFLTDTSSSTGGGSCSSSRFR
jgi:putative FmdB family regulatory protein